MSTSTPGPRWHQDDEQIEAERERLAAAQQAAEEEAQREQAAQEELQYYADTAAGAEYD